MLITRLQCPWKEHHNLLELKLFTEVERKDKARGGTNQTQQTLSRWVTSLNHTVRILCLYELSFKQFKQSLSNNIKLRLCVNVS